MVCDDSDVIMNCVATFVLWNNIAHRWIAINLTGGTSVTVIMVSTVSMSENEQMCILVRARMFVGLCGCMFLRVKKQYGDNGNQIISFVMKTSPIVPVFFVQTNSNGLVGGRQLTGHFQIHFVLFLFTFLVRWQLWFCFYSITSGLLSPWRETVEIAIDSVVSSQTATVVSLSYSPDRVYAASGNCWPVVATVPFRLAATKVVFCISVGTATFMPPQMRFYAYIRACM